MSAHSDARRRNPNQAHRPASESKRAFLFLLKGAAIALSGYLALVLFSLIFG